MDYALKLSKEFNVRADHSANIISLIDEGNTIPFIARYRKEMTGSCDDQVLREFNDRLKYLRNLDKRKQEIVDSITEQGKMTDEIAFALVKAETLTEAEDIYRPYKQKRKTRASVAVEKGLAPLADFILEQTDLSVNEKAKEFIDAEKGVENVEQAIAGASDIIAEKVSDDAELRKVLRKKITEVGELTCKLLENENAKTYDMYAEYSEKISKIPSHRILAVNRGEKEECLKVGVSVNTEEFVDAICAVYVKNDSESGQIVKNACADAYSRLIFPSIEREVRSDLTEKASEQAIKMFEVNLRPLLLQPPLKGKIILGLDPAYRTGCKIAVVDSEGNVLDTAVVFPTPPQNKIEEAQAILLKLIEKHNVSVISIGNGTASKESEIFVANMIKESGKDLSYAVVNEAGASVYSASKLGAEEFPDYEPAQRSAVSIARRLQDPLAELIKIDVKSIGVGQYQHDMPEKRLEEVLGGVVEDCVNSVGVDLNTASQSLLSYVAGLNKGIAKEITEYRKKTPFICREDLLKVKKLGAKAFEQCAGFLRIVGGNVLDNTGVHPESYPAVEKLLKAVEYSLDDVANGKIGDLLAKIEEKGWEKTAEECGVGVPTLKDISAELLKPGRDIRDSLPKPILRSDLMDLSDLKEGMEINGTVRNVIDFGVFVDIGVHQDGLVHISQISDNYIKHPSDVLKVGDLVKVKVLGVDTVKKKISLTMKTADLPNGIAVANQKTDRERKQGRMNAEKKREHEKKQMSNEDMVALLMKKFGR
ncbi:MAG: RNA-binding transcriptional accessory protein [Clostridiales bacterium]|nr:RNA-binding transcriptional accessory protein [Clostridiales bacterium]